MRTGRGGSWELAALLLGFVLSSSGAEEANSWTNLAGHAFKAELVAIHGQTATFKPAGGGPAVDYPLSVFPPKEQERLRVALKDATIPAGLQSAYEFSARILKRSRLLHESGQMPEADYRTSVETTLSAFRQQAAPLVAQHQLSQERLELIVNELAAEKE